MQNKTRFDYSILIAVLGVLMGAFPYLERAFGISTSAVLCVGILLAYLLVHSLILYLDVQRRQYQIFDTASAGEGAEALAIIRSATRSIHTMHSFKFVPCEAYTKALINRLQEGVELIRLLPEEVAKDRSVSKWLQKFKNKGGNEYREYHLDVAGEHLPLNFTIVDKAIVIIYFPSQAKSERLNEIAVFRDRQLAEMFRNSFLRLQQHAQNSTVS